VAALGHGFGGYAAVRALQLAPASFRCAVALDAPMDLHAWLGSSDGTDASAAPAAGSIPRALIEHPGADWKKLSVIEQADALTAPVLLAFETGHSAAVDAGVADLRNRLGALGRAPETVELDAGFATSAVARAKAYRRIDDFLKRNLGGPAATAVVTKEKQ
jgi:pimeloyl-ACP methyl ester carboxylesterase